MNPEVKAEWIEKLRSGNYFQGMGALHKVFPLHMERKPEFCCIGVLCESAREHGVLVRDDPDEAAASTASFTGSLIKYYSVRDTRDYTPALAPKSVIEWSEIDGPHCNVPMRDEYKKYLDSAIHDAVIIGLVELNDGGMPFSEIADIIEREL